MKMALETTLPPDAARARGIIAVAAAAAFVTVHIIIEHSYSALQGAIAHDLALSLGESAIYAAFYLAGYGLCQLPAGLLLDRYGPRNILWIAAALAALSMLLLSWVETPLAVGATRFTAGMTTSFAFTGAALVARQRLPRKWFTPAMGVLEASMGLGGAAGLWLVGELLPTIGWRPTVQVIAALTALAAIACLFCIGFARDPPAPALARKAHNSFRTSLWVVVSNAQIRRCAFIYGIMLGNVFGFAGFWNLQLMVAWGVNFEESVSDNVSLMIGLAVSALVVGTMARTFAAMRTVLIVSNIFAAIMLLTDLFLDWPTTHIGILIYSLVLGMSLGTSVVCFPLACSKVESSAVATAVACVNCAGLVGAVIIEAVPGVILTLLDRSDLLGLQIALIMVIPMTLAAAWAARGIATDGAAAERL